MDQLSRLLEHCCCLKAVVRQIWFVRRGICWVGYRSLRCVNDGDSLVVVVWEGISGRGSYRVW